MDNAFYVPTFRPLLSYAAVHLFITDTNYPRFYVKGLCIKTQAQAEPDYGVPRRAVGQRGWEGGGAQGGIRRRDRCWLPRRQGARKSEKDKSFRVRGMECYYCYPLPPRSRAEPGRHLLKINYALTRVSYIFHLLITMSQVCFLRFIFTPLVSAAEYCLQIAAARLILVIERGIKWKVSPLISIFVMDGTPSEVWRARRRASRKPGPPVYAVEPRYSFHNFRRELV